MTKYSLIRRTRFILSLTALCVFSTTLLAWSGDHLDLDSRTVLRGYFSALRYPDDRVLFPEKESSGVAGVARWIVEADIGKHWQWEFNVYQSYLPSNLLQTGEAASTVAVERSDVLEKNLSDSDYAHLAVDRLAIRWFNRNFDVTLGRQPVNLATTFYFSPNDFFAPFSAHTFYRVYKPGVDAMRIEIGLGDLTQLSLMNVLGYQPDRKNDTGWSDRVDIDRSSYLMHVAHASGVMEGSLLLGRVKEKKIIGLAFQGELYEWLGLRMEGHHASPQNEALGDYQQLTLGLEHRWENSLEIRGEYHYNRAGSKSFLETGLDNQQYGLMYPGRHYFALGGSYEITPLLIGQSVITTNLDDQSYLASFNTVYSLSNESDLVAGLGLPIGSIPENGRINSEYGSYPYTFNLEIRAYF